MTVISNALIGRLVAAAAAVLLAGRALPASAQTMNSMSNPAPAKAAPAKTAKPAKPAAAPANAGAMPDDYWTVKADLPKQYGAAVRDTAARRGNAVEYDKATDTYREVPRVPLRNLPGTVGFGSTPVHGGQIGDGRSAPGQELYSQPSSSYAGMSINIPSNTRSFVIPIPATPQNRNDW